MKKRMSPQQKKKLAYERDHYTLGESRHGFRRKWPKKKARANQKHRHLSNQALHRLETLGNLEEIEDSALEVSADQLRKTHPKEKLSKWRVKSLKEYVESRHESRESRAEHNRANRELIEERCKVLIHALEKAPNSQTVRDFIRQVEMGGGWGWDFWMFLRWRPEWRPRLERAWSEVLGARQKAERKQQNKETEKRRAKALRKAAQVRTGIR